MAMVQRAYYVAGDGVALPYLPGSSVGVTGIGDTEPRPPGHPLGSVKYCEISSTPSHCVPSQNGIGVRFESEVSHEYTDW